MKFVIQISSHPMRSASALTAYHYTKAVLDSGYQVPRVFFYKDGAYHAFRYTTPAQDELNLTRQWSELAARYELDLVVCISAAQRRGLLIADEAARQGKHDDDVAAGFRIGGLGQMAEAVLNADRILEFV